MDIQDTLLLSPNEPSSLTTTFGTINIEIPLVPSGEPGTFARTRWIIFSVILCSPKVIQTFVPVTLYVPSSCFSAFVVIVPKSEPD